MTKIDNKEGNRGRRRGRRRGVIGEEEERRQQGEEKRGDNKERIGEIRRGYNKDQRGTAEASVNGNTLDTSDKAPEVHLKSTREYRNGTKLPDGSSLKFAKVSINGGDAYNAETGIFTCPLDAIYHFMVHMSVYGHNICKKGETALSLYHTSLPDKCSESSKCQWCCQIR
ncbi:Collagen alpha-2(VIII) chain [Merluccius polli]|uniref:Collagen alpha-2(VIII) chain n=1 Tax=Merluccius polli TaxID=89951 RepID=A0AA47MAS7_MERPO|nr:Collagen alpha-2(VIII) chain [Merluccius polli]